MGSIKGKIRVIIYESDSNYKVGVIRVKETSDKEMEDFVGRTVHFTGYFANLQIGDNYEMEGNLIYKDKYGYQYNVTDYKRVEVKGRDAVIEFLTSDLVKGCGEATATLIVDTLGEDCLKKIKEDPEVLLTVPKMTQKKAEKIYRSLMKVANTDEMLIGLKELGFSISEALNIINKFGPNALSITKSNPYALREIIDFRKLDNVYMNLGIPDDYLRTKNCLLETIRELEIKNGDTYFFEEELRDGLKNYFGILTDDNLPNILSFQ